MRSTGERQLVGAYNGRVWHLSGSYSRGVWRTLCGLAVNREWQPYSGRQVGTCAKCRALDGAS